MELIWLFFGALIVVAFFWNSSKKTPVVTNNEFSQAGVIVNFDNKTISIKGAVYSVDDVRQIGMTGNKITVTVSDMVTPNHTVSIPGMNLDNAKDFYSRLTTALERAGASFK